MTSFDIDDWYRSKIEAALPGRRFSPDEVQEIVLQGHIAYQRFVNTAAPDKRPVASLRPGDSFLHQGEWLSISTIDADGDRCTVRTTCGRVLLLGHGVQVPFCWGHPTAYVEDGAITPESIGGDLDATLGDLSSRLRLDSTP